MAKLMRLLYAILFLFILAAILMIAAIVTLLLPTGAL